MKLNFPLRQKKASEDKVVKSEKVS